MSNSVKSPRALISIAAAIALIAGVGFVLYTLPHWWHKVGVAESRTVHGPLGTVTVYKSTGGNLLFRIDEDSLQNHFIYYPADGRIGIPNGNQFIYIPFVDLLAYSKDVPVPVVYSDDKIKIENDMNIILENNRLEFDRRPGVRVTADLNSY